jgi:serine phosphatase RsbU (regulator of sigma subunit)
MLAAIFVLRATVTGEPGPLLLFPVLLSAFWFGRAGGLAVAAVAAVLYAVARAIHPAHDSLSVVEAGLLRLLLYGIAAYIVGWLAEQRRTLTATVSAQHAKLAELRGIQQALAPSDAPRRPWLELASCYVPAEHGAAGDFYLVTEATGDSTVVVVGDVAGKGIEAARRAAFVRTALATAAPYTDDPCRLLESANTALLDRGGGSELLVTCACIAFSPETHTVRWALAGHPAPMWLDDGTPLNTVSPAYPLGVEPYLECRSSSTSLSPGAGLLAFTDGLSEARRNGGELFGTERIAHALAGMRGAAPAQVVRQLRSQAESFAGGALTDDLCIVALRAS